MKKFNIYKKHNKGGEADVVAVKQSFSLFGLLFGPWLYVFFKMWKFLLYAIIFMTLLNLIYKQDIITAEFYQILWFAFYLYIAIDFSNQYEQHLLSVGYEYDGFVYSESKFAAKELSLVEAV